MATDSELAAFNDPERTRFAERGDGPNAYARRGRLVKRQQRKADEALQQLQAFIDAGDGMPTGTPASTPSADDALVGDSPEETDLALLAGDEGPTSGRIHLPERRGIAITASDGEDEIAISPARAAALRGGRVPGQQEAEAAAKAAAEAAERQRQQQQQNLTVIQKGAQTAKQGAGLATSGWTNLHDTIANAPAPPEGSIWALVAAIIVLIILVYPVNGVPRLGWLWLVLTRRATLAGDSLYGAPASLTDQEQGWANSSTNLSASQKAAQDIASAQNSTATAVHTAAAVAVNATQNWLNDTGLRVVSRYVPGA